jgi:hypothetical protein
MATARTCGSNNLAILWQILKIRCEFQTCFNISYSLIIDHLISYNELPTKKYGHAYEVRLTRVISGSVMYSTPQERSWHHHYHRRLRRNHH